VDFKGSWKIIFHLPVLQREEMGYRKEEGCNQSHTCPLPPNHFMSPWLRLLCDVTGLD